MSKSKFLHIILVILFSMVIASPKLEAHCQVPCGIYDDQMRINMMLEHITTIEKSMNRISVLSGEKPLNFNQIVRWVTTKENHAEEMSRIITDYFMAQRIQPTPPVEGGPYSTYQNRLELLHGLLVLTMKSKQDIDLAVVNKMRAMLKKFERAYFQNH
jgi:nickel superoxide dismutase